MLPWLHVRQDLPAPSVNLLMHTFFMELLLLEALGLILAEGPSAVRCPSCGLAGSLCLWHTHNRGSINRDTL